MTAMQRVLVLGADGQLGRELRRARVPKGLTLLFASRGDIDIASEGAADAVAAIKPNAIINAAAYTAVDKAEAEPALAFAVNRDGPRSLASAAATLGAPLLQISTDYVFDGAKGAPYLETDIKHPLNVYGQSKSEGEDAVLSNHATALVLRTSWVYSPFGSNFVKSMLKLGATREEVRVVNDQVGRPTAANDLAATCLALIMKQLAGDEAARGVLHFANAGAASWADFAEAIFSEAARNRQFATVTRIPSAEYPTPAKRPANSRLDTSRIETAFGITARPWRAALNDCLAELLN